MIDLQKLRKITDDAIVAKKQLELDDLLEKQQKAAEVAAEHKRIADNIIANIPSLCEKAAWLGESKVKIMRLVAGRDYRYDSQKENQHYGVAALVYDYCVNEGITPKREQWDDGGGMNGGYDLYVSW